MTGIRTQTAMGTGFDISLEASPGFVVKNRINRLLDPFRGQLFSTPFNSFVLYPDAFFHSVLLFLPILDVAHHAEFRPDVCPGQGSQQHVT